MTNKQLEKGLYLREKAAHEETICKWVDRLIHNRKEVKINIQSEADDDETLAEKIFSLHGYDVSEELVTEMLLIIKKHHEEKLRNFKKEFDGL